MPTSLNRYAPPLEDECLLAPEAPVEIDLEDRSFRGSISQFVENYMMIEGKPFRFNRREYLRPIYDESYSQSQRTILRTARQCEKSSLLAMKQLAHVSVIPWFKTLYVSSSQMQTRQFSNDRVRANADLSPFVARLMRGKTTSDGVFDKVLSNGSRMYFRYAYLTPDRCRGISADLLCYDKNTEVLTYGGWKNVTELSVFDLIADVNDDGVVEWNYPSYVFTKLHSGLMVSFNHSGMNLRVTSDHNMVVNYKVKHDKRYKQKDEWVFETALDLASTKRMGFKVSCAAEWGGDCPEERVFPDWECTQRVSNDRVKTGRTRIRKFKGLTVKYLPFAKVVGYWLAEGHINWDKSKGRKPSPRGVITQNKGAVLADIKKSLDDAGIEWNSYDVNDGKGEVIHMHHSCLGRYLAELGKSWTKYIPREFYEHPKLLEALLRGLYAGDAMYHKGEAWDNGTLKTRSRRLAEDTQEAWLRIKRPAVIHTDWAGSRATNGVNSHLSVWAPIYLVCAYNKDYKIFWRSEFEKKKRIETEMVLEEPVYCFNVPNHRPIVKGGFGASPVISGNCVDEIQDILTDNIPVIRECLSHSEYKHEVYSGTPKTLANAIEFYWERSTQNEWLVKCRSCRYYNYLDMGCLGEKSLVCTKCGKAIYPTDGQWIRMNTGGKWEGFRIPQLMVPWVPYKEILEKRDDYSTARFHNEVLGLPYDSGVKPITEAQLRSCCNYGPMSIGLDDRCNGFPIFAGLDWGSGEGETPSWTVLTLGAFIRPPVFTVIYCKRFTGPEAELLTQVPKIGQILSQFNFALAGADWGYGHYMNLQLREAWGIPKIIEYQYVVQNIPIKFEQANLRFKVDRTSIMSEYFHQIKQQRIQFFDWDEFATFGADYLNVDSEFGEKTGKMRYIHMPDKPDDTLHSNIYAWLAARHYYGMDMQG